MDSTSASASTAGTPWPMPCATDVLLLSSYRRSTTRKSSTSFWNSQISPRISHG